MQSKADIEPPFFDCLIDIFVIGLILQEERLSNQLILPLPFVHTVVLSLHDQILIQNRKICPNSYKKQYNKYLINTISIKFNTKIPFSYINFMVRFE